MRNILLFFLLAAALAGQVASDPLGRLSPQQSIIRFLEACHSRDYQKATYYLDLRRMTPSDRSANAKELAEQLEDLLDDTSFDIATLSLSPDGDVSDDLSAQFEHLYTVNVAGQTIDLQLERVPLSSGLKVWLVSAPSVAQIPAAHKVIGESPLEKHLPQWTVSFEILDTPVWRWIALLILAVASWLAAGLAALAAPTGFRSSLRLVLATAAFRAALELATPSTLPRLFIERGLALLFVIAAAWLLANILDFLAERWGAQLDPRTQAISYSILPLGRQILKLALFLIGILGLLNAWGYNTSTIVAGLGVGGLAVALAAQKTIENLFGGVSIIGDRPVLVGDTCRFGDRTGVITHIGLRSTRIRTPERTIISVPNSQFSSMPLENISGRDKILFHAVLNLRRETTSAQLQAVLSAIAEILRVHTKVEEGTIPVRFVGVGQYSLDVEVSAYVTTSVYDEFLAIQQELLISLIRAVEQAGTALAVPVQESVAPSQPAA